jgi:hypothetical protein
VAVVASQHLFRTIRREFVFSLPTLSRSSADQHTALVGKREALAS